MMNDWQKGDEVWNVLGRSRPVNVSPYFSRRVMAATRTTPARSMVPVSVLRWLGGVAFAVLAFGFFVSLEPGTTAALATNSPEFVEVFDAAAGLDKIATTTEFSVTQFASGL